MKKIVMVIMFCLSQSCFANNTVRIYHPAAQYNLFINYQACFRDAKNGGAITCLYPIFNYTVQEGMSYADIVLPDYTDYARIVNVYEYNEDEGTAAQGDYPGENDCQIYPNHAVTFVKQNDMVNCIR